MKKQQIYSQNESLILDLQDVSVYYDEIQVLHNVNIEVRHQEIVTLIGANGAGKSSLLMTICGTPKARYGNIIYSGENIVDKKTSDIMQSGLAVVPEGRRVFSRLTVEENLTMGAFFQNSDNYQKNLEYVLTLFPRLKERFKQKSGTMSGGEQQMLAIGRALMSSPRLLLLDEPSLGLAPIIIKQIFEIIDTLRKEGMTIFLVEQNAHQALKIADRGYVLENGRIVLEGQGSQLLINPAVKAAYLGV